MRNKVWSKYRILGYLVATHFILPLVLFFFAIIKWKSVFSTILFIKHTNVRVGLSPTSASRRLKILQESAVITGYSALLDEVALGFEVTVFVSVRLEKQIDAALEEFEKAVEER